MNLSALADAVMLQRQERLTDSGPQLRGVGSARFQLYGTMLIVGAVQPRHNRLGELIDRIVRYARERWLAISWTFTPGYDPPQVPVELQRYGFQLRETLKLMGLIGKTKPLAPPPVELSVGTIRTLTNMQYYERLSNWGFGDNPNPFPERVIARAQERWEEQQAGLYQYYMGWHNEEPASGAYVSLWERVPTIYGVVTAPPFRRQGIAGHVMQRLIQDTLDRGFSWTCLYVALGNPAELLYQRLGFTALAEQSTYYLGAYR